MTREISITAEQMLPVPETRWQRIWRWLCRRQAPTANPPGTSPLVIEMTNGDGSMSRIFIPAARLSES